MKKEKPRFFCDYCGSEVSQESEECPECGRSFASVRCPYCGFTGGAEIFQAGCPDCGATFPSGTKEGASKPKESQASRPARAIILPLWVYIVTGLVFISVLVALFSL